MGGNSTSRGTKARDLGGVYSMLYIYIYNRYSRDMPACCLQLSKLNNEEGGGGGSLIPRWSMGKKKCLGTDRQVSMDTAGMLAEPIRSQKR